MALFTYKLTTSLIKLLKEFQSVAKTLYDSTTSMETCKVCTYPVNRSWGETRQKWRQAWKTLLGERNGLCRKLRRKALESREGPAFPSGGCSENTAFVSVQQNLLSIYTVNKTSSKDNLNVLGEYIETGRLLEDLYLTDETEEPIKSDEAQELVEAEKPE